MKLISEELVLNELESFIQEWVEKPFERKDLKEVFSKTYNALESGNLTLIDNVPTYKLNTPIKDKDGEDAIKEINFQTRIVPSEQAKLAKGIDIFNDELEFQLRSISYIIGQPKAIIDKFSKKDYNTIREVASFFL